MSYTRGTRGIIADILNKSIAFLKKFQDIFCSFNRLYVRADMKSALTLISTVEAGEAVAQDLVGFVNDHKGIRVQVGHQLLQRCQLLAADGC